MEMTGFGVGLWKGKRLEVTGGSKGLGFGEKALHLSRLVKKAIWPWWEVPCILSPDFPLGHLLPSGYFHLVFPSWDRPKQITPCQRKVVDDNQESSQAGFPFLKPAEFVCAAGNN